MAEKKAIPAVGRNRGLGMVMHRKVVDELKRLGLSCHPYLTVVFQQKQKRWMLAGEEGGGSTADVGHYVGFTGIMPSGIAVSIPIQSLVPNSTQRRVIAQEMIRAQIFRYGNSCNSIAASRASPERCLTRLPIPREHSDRLPRFCQWFSSQSTPGQPIMDCSLLAGSRKVIPSLSGVTPPQRKRPFASGLGGLNRSCGRHQAK